MKREEDTLIRSLTAAMLYRRRTGLTAQESMVIHLIATSEGACQREIGEIGGIAPDQMAKVCRVLEQRGFIQQTLAVDRRRKLLSLGPAGVKYLRGVMKATTRARLRE